MRFSRNSFVVRNLHHSGVLGMDMLQACKAVIDLGDKSLRLFYNMVVVAAYNGSR
jgi:hypothetical protein